MPTTPVLHRRPRSSGFTLLEVIVAMAVLSILLLGAFAAIARTATLNDMTSQEIIANNIIRQTIENIYHCAAFGPTADSGQDQSHRGIPAVVAQYRLPAYRSFRPTLPGEIAAPADVDAMRPRGTVTLYLNEAEVPGGTFHARDESAPPPTEADLIARGFDLDGDGLITSDYTDALPGDAALRDLHLLPVEITVTWSYRQQEMTMRRFVLLPRTTGD